MNHPTDPRKHVLVTGGSHGIGRAIVQRLIEDGFFVSNLDVQAPSQPLAQERFFAADLGKTENIADYLAQATQDCAALNLVNNVGISLPALLEDISSEQLQAMLSINLVAAILFCQGLVSNMKQHQYGRIVNITSRAAQGKEKRTVYSATKGGLIGMTNTLALELARHGITVNAIGPGPIYSDLFARLNPPGSPAEQQFLASIPAERFGQPTEVAHAVASLIDPRASYITGQTIYVCGGTSLAYHYTAV